MPSKDTLETALSRFKFVAEVERAQRQHEREQTRFVANDQWTDAAKQMRQGTPNGSFPAIGARPCLTINLIDAPVQQVVNQFHDSDLGVHVTPLDEAASEDTANMLDEFYVELQQASKANVARGWAFRSAVQSGRGYYRVLTDYESDTGFDQVLKIARILNQHSVYLDPFAVEPDWSDGEWAFVTEDLPMATFKRRYPKSKIATADQSELESYGNMAPQWVTTSQEGASVRVAEYWYCDYEKETIKGDAEPVGEGEAPSAPPTREINHRTIKWCKITAAEVLEDAEWGGHYIPIIPVIGKEWHLGNERRWDGMPAPAMDSNRAANSLFSAAVERIALMPKAPFIAAIGQIEDFLPWWNQANITNLPYLPYKPVDVNGTAVPAPQRESVEPAIQGIVTLAQMFVQNVRLTTGVPDVALGNPDPTQKSKGALLALQRQMEHGTGHYLNNMREISLPYEAKVILDLIPVIYDRPGRQVHVQAKDGTRKKVTLNQQYAEKPGGPVKFYDLSEGRYGVTATVSKAFATRRAETSEALAELIQADPSLMTVFGDQYLGNEDFAGHEMLEQRMQAVLDPRVLATMQGNKDIPPQVQAQVAQMQGQMQQLGQALQQAQQAIQTKQVESQAKLQEAQMDNDTKIKIAVIQASAQVGIAQEKIDAENARTYLEAVEERFGKILDLHMKNLHKVLDQQQAMTIQGHAQSHDVGLAAMQHAHSLGAAVQASDLAPAPQPQADGAGNE